MSLTSLLNASLSDAPWSVANWTTDGSNDTEPFNATGLPYDQTPADLRQYILIIRLVLLGIGVFDTLLLLLVYVKCSNIIISSLGVYVANLSLAALIDMVDIGIWALKEFGYQLEDVYPLPWWAYKLPQLPQFGLPTTSLFLLLLIIDRFFATIAAGCHKGCYGFKPNAVFLTLIFWAGSFFLTFVLVYQDLLFPHEALYEQLRFLIAYLGPWALKFLLLIVLFAKRKVVPDNDASQGMIHRQRESLYYALTIIFLHLIFSAPYYAIQVKLWQCKHLHFNFKFCFTGEFVVPLR